VSAYRSARAALAAFLAFHGVKRVWLPAYTCASLAEGAAACEQRWFTVDPTLKPDAAQLCAELRPGDAVVGVDYFGRAPGAEFLDLVTDRPDVLWIEDRAQALDTGRSDWGRAMLYSPRKLIGVGDGGLLVSDLPLPEPGAPHQDDAAAQIARAGDPDGQEPDRWFPLFQAQERAFAVDDAAMSPRSRLILERVAIAPLAAARRANAAFLGAQLGDLALWPDDPVEHAPLAFPLRLADAADAAARLAVEGVFCARHWAELPSDAVRFPDAHRLSGQLLSLPCDHRYDLADMARIVAHVRALQLRGAR
jgi:dTDP-4-amino-4,6-dideoxygalactose transaminase